ncbi:MAG TPA: carboxypeptidase regulatory-like domain-containing protein [Terriglobales bacterium]|nr:carboxypeptidase regulatory-like domain-containing protein [Terriglobales bacterium]
MTCHFRSMFGRNRFTWLLAVLALTGTLAVQMVGQSSVTGDIAGTVTDPSGAVVSGAKVSAKSTTTDVTQTTTTNAGGSFRLPLLKPGTYRLTVTQNGFRTASETVEVAVSAVANVSIKLDVGQTSETVEVTAGTPLIETENANLSTTFNTTQVENLPNGGNDITAYAQTAPGVLMNSSSGGGYGNFTAFGLPATSNLFTVNGNDEMDPYLNLNNSGATNLLLGANEVEEVGVTSNGYTGQYGRMAGAQVNYSTKSGGNAFHGNAKYWYNTQSFNATDWFLNNTGTKPGFDVNNQYAAAIGGPIVKDKLFFFVGTEGLRYVLATSNQIFVPTQAFETAVLNNIGPTYGAVNSAPFYQNLFSLFNNAPGAANAVPVTAPGTGFGCGDINEFNPNTGVPGPMPGFENFGEPGFISASEGLPLAGPGGTPCAAQFRSTVGALSTEWLMYGKVDWVHTNNDRWSIRMKTDHGLQPTYIDFLTPNFNAISDQPAWEGQLTNTHIFSNSVVNQFIGSVFWYSAIFKQSNASLAAATLPYAIYDFDSPFGNPSTAVMAGGEQNVFPQGRNVTQYQLADDVSISKGNHGLKFGVNFRRDDITDASPGVRTIPRARVFSTSDFAAGFIDQFSQRFPGSLEQRIANYSIGFYAQDEWRVDPKLKLTLTIRLDRNSNVTCPSNCFSRFATEFSQLNHDPTIPFNQGIKNNLNTAFSSVQPIVAEPRFGFAYNLHQNTVLRGGVGLFSDLYPATLADNFLDQAPFDPTFTIAGFLSPAEGAASAAATAAGCNTAFQTTYAGGGTVADYHAAAPGGCNVPDYHDSVNHIKNPTYVEWNLELQHAISNRTAVSINYVGNRGYDEFIYNDLVNAYQASGASGLPTTVPDQRVRNVNGVSNGGFSNYNGLTASVTQRALYGLQFSANYTWSHANDIISNGGILPYSFNDSLGAIANPFNPRALNYGPSDYDIRHNFNANYVWQPTTHFQGLMDKALGGWTISGTFFVRSGYPFTVENTGAGFSNGTGFAVGYSPLPIFLGGSSTDCPGHSQTTPCFSLSQFNSTTSTFGVTRRNSFRGPHYFNSDFAVLKNFKLSERFNFGLGANAYNVFNHPNFGNPNHDMSGGSFGMSETTVEPPTSPYGAFVGSAVSGRVVQLHAELKF